MLGQRSSTSHFWGRPPRISSFGIGKLSEQHEFRSPSAWQSDMNTEGIAVIQLADTLRAFAARARHVLCLR